MQTSPYQFFDKNQKEIKLGDIIEFTVGKYSGDEMIFLFCIPQHRFGFMFVRHVSMDDLREQGYMTKTANLKIYYTPASSQTFVKVETEDGQ